MAARGSRKIVNNNGERLQPVTVNWDVDPKADGRRQNRST